MKKTAINKSKNMLKVGFYFIFIGLYYTTRVSAYIDPATTATLTQIIAGVVISAGVLFGVFWRKIQLFFKNMSIKSTQKKIEKQQQKKNN